MKYTLKQDFTAHQGALYTLCQGASPAHFFSGGSDRKVMLWNLETMQLEKLVASSPTTIISLAYIAEGDILLIGQAEGGIHVLDLKAGKEIHYLKTHQNYIFDMQVLPEQKQVVAASGDGSFSVYSSENFKLLFHSKRCTAKIRAIAYQKERKQIALGLGTGLVELWDVENWKLSECIEGFQSSVNSLLFLNSNELVVGEKDAYLSLVKLQSSSIEKRIPAHNWAIYSLVQGVDDSRFASASRDKTIKIWDVESLSVEKRLSGFKDLAHSHSVNQLLWTSFENYLVSCGDDGKIKVWTGH